MEYQFNYLRNPFVLPEIESACVFREAQRIWLGNHVRFLRGAMIEADLSGRIEIRDGAAVCRFAIIQSVGGEIVIGRRSCIGDFCSLYGQGGLRIGDDVMISSGVRIVPNQHTFDSAAVPISAQSCNSKGILIGDGVWIGTNAVILDGVCIGDGAIVGAGAVVTNNVQTGAIVAGVPGRVLRLRPGF